MTRREEGGRRWKGREGGKETNGRRDDRLSSTHSQAEIHNAQQDKQTGGMVDYSTTTMWNEW
jgi:hypothetical protein